ncbi:MAG: hypothetical protein AVDCRST_MAG59-2988, partial [uncultured Thermomicrobiales bacterium]
GPDGRDDRRGRPPRLRHLRPRRHVRLPRRPQPIRRQPVRGRRGQRGGPLRLRGDPAGPTRDRGPARLGSGGTMAAADRALAGPPRDRPRRPLPAPHRRPSQGLRGQEG